MQLKEIRVRIKKDQKLLLKTEIEPTQGFVGDQCLKATADLEEALGKLEGRDSKPEMSLTSEIGLTTGQG